MKTKVNSMLSPNKLLPGMAAFQRHWLNHLSSAKPKLNKKRLKEKR